MASDLAGTHEQANALMLLRRGRDALGAPSAVFISFVRDSVDISCCRVLLAGDPDWCRRHLTEAQLPTDPWLAYAAQHGEPVLASSLSGQPVATAGQGHATDHGFASALLLPAHSGTGHSRISLLVLGADEPGFYEHMPDARLRFGARGLAQAFHDWWLHRIKAELVLRARITEGDLELLRHQHLGHSSKRIAADLRVRPSSINSRFQRMNVKLGVPNRRVAAQLAAECGLIQA